MDYQTKVKKMKKDESAFDDVTNSVMNKLYRNTIDKQTRIVVGYGSYTWAFYFRCHNLTTNTEEEVYVTQIMNWYQIQRGELTPPETGSLEKVIDELRISLR